MLHPVIDCVPKLRAEEACIILQDQPAKVLTQSLAKLPLTMLPNAVRILCLQMITLFLAIVALCAVTNSAFITEFITMKRGSNWTADELPEQSSAIELSRMGRTEAMMRSHENHYQLRFRPVEQFKHLFWHKFPKPQQVDPESTTQQPEQPMEPVPTEPTVDMETTTAPTEAPATTTTTTTTTASPTRKPMRPVSSTKSTTIMKPNTLPPHLGSSLKQLLLFGSPLEANLIEKQPAAPKTTRSKGFLSLFEVIKFENNKCSVAMGDIRTLEGVCYHEFECKSLGGISTERCAEGVGVCCVFVTACGDATNQPIVYFESPNYPNAVLEMLICVLTVNLRKRVQQLRLDFLMFELNRPTNGDCLDDQFIVAGQDINFVVPILCGINTGQHIYIDVGNSYERKIYLSFLAKVPSGGRSFNIKITQLETDLAPAGCLQYYTEIAGIVKSFNYDKEGSVVENSEATYLNNLNYAICLERVKDSCTVTYTTEIIGGDQLDFQIVNKDEAENDLVPDGQAGVGIFNCPDDFIAVNQVRLCGERLNDATVNDDFNLNAPVKDIAAGPIILPFRSDAEYVGRGFRLIYRQDLCV